MSGIAEQARAAYAAGWAASGGPMTARVRAGAVVAVELACQHHGNGVGGVVEATMRLGEMEGVWAAVYDRRERVYAEYSARALDAWRGLAAVLDVDGAVLTLRRQMALTNESADADEDEDEGGGEEDDLDPVAAPVPVEDEDDGLLVWIVLGLLAELFHDRADPRYQYLVDVLAEALRVAEAEGVVGAWALAAEQVGLVGMDYDAVYADALADVGDRTEQAEALLVAVARGTATLLVLLLLRLLRSGAGYAEMVAAVAELLGSDRLRSLLAEVDLAVGRAFNAAAVAWYARHGVREVDLITVGGADVCAYCLDLEAHNPHQLGDVPDPPLHPYCRCVLVPRDPIQPAGGWATYFPGGI